MFPPIPPPLYPNAPPPRRVALCWLLKYDRSLKDNYKNVLSELLWLKLYIACNFVFVLLTWICFVFSFAGFTLEASPGAQVHRIIRNEEISQKVARQEIWGANTPRHNKSPTPAYLFLVKRLGWRWR
jgi:hypothetical protein